MIQQLKEAFESSCEKLGCDLLEVDGEQDHVHLLIAYPPKLAVSVMVNNLKSVSSRRLSKDFEYTQSKSGRLWSRSYFACSAGGATIETLKEYVNSRVHLTDYIQTLNRNVRRIPVLYPRPIGLGFTTILLNLFFLSVINAQGNKSPLE